MEGGARLLQVRAKAWPANKLLDAVVAIVDRGRGVDAAVIVNDRADVASVSRAAGVHVGQEDISPGSARAVVGAEAVVGLSTHTREQVEASAYEPITYLAVGPVFGTVTKDTGYAPVGVELVRFAAAHAHRLPVVAIGGITLSNCDELVRAGASSVAVISDLLTTNDPGRRVSQFLKKLRN
jgi:thiamine-phosphate pyrophosphorylase